AAAGYVPAIAGALSQEIVDLATILNALRSLSPGRHMAPVRGQAGVSTAAITRTVFR
ncbi:atpase, coupled to transmembrane movement of ions, phosphorylative mechanism, partial [Arthrobacter sp. Hiyo6]